MYDIKTHTGITWLSIVLCSNNESNHAVARGCVNEGAHGNDERHKLMKQNAVYRETTHTRRTTLATPYRGFVKFQAYRDNMPSSPRVQPV